MTESDTYTILSQTFLTVLYGSGPIMGVALVIGLVIAFFQALTQVQEMTLTFVPKIVMIFVTLLAGYYLGPVSLFLTVPLVVALFYPINGLSVTDRVSGSVVVQVPGKARKKP